MAATSNKFFLGLAAGNALIALAHVAKGREQFKHLSIQKLPTTLRGAVQIGWYEGGVFFLIMGVLNYKWSQIGVLDVFDKGIIGLYVSLLFGAGASYLSSGDSATGTVLPILGFFQGLAAYRA